MLAPLARPQHRAALEALVRATGVFSESEVAIAVELYDSDDPDYALVGAFMENTLVGYACYGPTPGTDRGYDLYWIAVHPSAQRAGLGAAILADVERRVAADNARMMVIETSSRDAYAPTRRFYQRHGYTEAARVGSFYAPGDDRIVYTKRFQPPPRQRGEEAT
ncbi:MAG TPA: GNAT family N-acetyltransferase [Gemmatimonadaceae bacterium]|nr:GNAT family N-acetyltransferase [Gemmatimonadaceae bacterium]